MMKKLALIALSLMLLLSTVAYAEATDMKLYTNPTNGYEISYPADWMLMDRSTIDEILKMGQEGKVEGMDASVLEQYKAQIDAMDMMLCVAPNGSANFNINYVDVGAEVTAQDVIDQLCPSALQQFQTMFAEMEVLVPGALMTSGSNEYAYMALRITSGQQKMTMVQTYATSGTILYTITYTLVDDLVTDMEAMDKITEAIAASFVPGK